VAVPACLLPEGIKKSRHYPEHVPQGERLDNSVMENFFGLLKSELLYLQEFKSLEYFEKNCMNIFITTTTRESS